jgi:hypothetical protein
MQIIPNAKVQFIDQNGLPLASGTVGFYFPGTLNPKPTYQDSAGTIANTNPVTLDSRGQAIIWGSGVYRQIVKDASGVTIWDQITEDPDAGLTGNITDAKFVSGVDFTNGVTTQLTLPVSPGSASNTWVFFDAGFQADDQYTISGTTLTFNAPIPVGVQEVNVKIGTLVAVGVPANGSVGDQQLAWGSILSRACDSVGAVQALDPGKYKRAFAAGYYAPGDGGGGSYYYSALSTASANGGTILSALGGAGRWLLEYDASVSVLQFGAKADNGVTDNGPIFNAASAWCWQNNVPLEIPASRTNNVYGFSTAWSDSGWGTSGNANAAITIRSDPTAALKAYAAMASMIDFTHVYKFNCKIELGILNGGGLATAVTTFTNIQDSIIDVLYVGGFAQFGAVFIVPNSNPTNQTIFNNRIYLGTVAGGSVAGVTGVLLQSPVAGIYGVQGNWLQVGQVIACQRGIQIGQSGGDQTMYNTIVGGVVEISSANGIEDHSGSNIIGPIITDGNTSFGIVVFASAQPSTIIANMAADAFLDQTAKCSVNIINTTYAGQTYKDVTGSRALSTTYTNNSPRTIMVLVAVSMSSATPSAVKATIGALNIEGSIVAGVNFVSQITFPVPPGSTYSCTAVGGAGVLQTWQELS